MAASTPVIREANSTDADAIAQLLYRSHTISFAPFASIEWVESRRLDEYRTKWQSTLEAASKDDRTFVATIDGTLVGSVRVSPLESPEIEFDAQLSGMHVEPELTGHGVGGLLMRTALDFIRTRKFERVELGVIASNDGSRRFYESHGWILVRTLPDGIEGVPVAIYKLG
jgi:predicted N-acetyltransferase YhbS